MMSPFKPKPMRHEWTAADPCIFTPDMVATMTPLRVWQVIRQDPDGRVVDYGLFACEESAKNMRDRLVRTYPDDEDRLVISPRTVRP